MQSIFNAIHLKYTPTNGKKIVKYIHQYKTMMNSNIKSEKHDTGNTNWELYIKKCIGKTRYGLYRVYTIFSALCVGNITFLINNKIWNKEMNHCKKYKPPPQKKTNTLHSITNKKAQINLTLRSKYTISKTQKILPR